MAVTRAQVEYVAALARLRLASDEAERFTVQLNGILEHFEALSALDTDAVAAVGGAAEGTAPLRADIPGADTLAFPPSDLTSGWAESFFTVPTPEALKEEG